MGADSPACHEFAARRAQPIASAGETGTDALAQHARESGFSLC